MNDTRINAPCLNCTEREVGCHGRCQAYQEFSEWRKSFNSKSHIDRVADFYSDSKNRGLREKLLRKKDGRAHER